MVAQDPLDLDGTIPKNANRSACGKMLVPSLVLSRAHKERERAEKRRDREIEKVERKLDYRRYLQKRGLAIDGTIDASLERRLTRLQSGAPTFEGQARHLV